jgi:hypothetical protein
MMQFSVKIGGMAFRVFILFRACNVEGIDFNHYQLRTSGQSFT